MKGECGSPDAGSLSGDFDSLFEHRFVRVSEVAGFDSVKGTPLTTSLMTSWRLRFALSE